MLFYLLFRARTVIASALLLVGLTVFVTGQAHALRRPVWLFDEGDLAPVGYVNPTGRLVKVVVVGTGKPRPGRPGEILHLSVTVNQPGTNAVAVGAHVIPNVKSTVVAVAHVPPRSASFRPGLVIGTVQARHVFRGKVIRTWTWTSRVLLRR